MAAGIKGMAQAKPRALGTFTTRRLHPPHLAPDLHPHSYTSPSLFKCTGGKARDSPWPQRLSGTHFGVLWAPELGTKIPVSRVTPAPASHTLATFPYLSPPWEPRFAPSGFH